MSRKWKWLTIAVALLLGLQWMHCGTKDGTAEREKSPFLNLGDSAQYVGMDQCKSCHQNIYDTYIQTGMGQSFGMATRQKSAAQYGPHSLVYDSLNNYYYFPFWAGDSLFIREFRLEDGDTVHNRVEYVSYVIGSGQHTNSHLTNLHGFVYQAPITFYTQREQWDMAPGFEGGYSTRFGRIIGHECMTCHNALPKFVQGSVNKYEAVPTGIDCERCHGPGSLHVKAKLAGNLVDTSKHADYTIVNPAHLSKEEKMSICQRCHLQGVAVLNEGKQFDDFKPGMHLSDVMNVFLPRFSNAENDFIMASQADRLRMSPCYQKTDMTCTTCHNPHISVKVTSHAQFNTACTNCHGGAKAVTKLTCSADMAKRKAVNDDCSGCHMPKSGSIDIPHVNISDHYIRKHYEKPDVHLSVDQATKVKQFLGLQCMTKENPTETDMANGFLHFYESYSSRPYLLDSAENRLLRGNFGQEKLLTAVHLYFLKENYNKVVEYAAKYDIKTINDPWTLYRIGEAYFRLGNLPNAGQYFNKAVTVNPYNLDFLNKKAAVQFGQKDANGAKQTYESILRIQPAYEPALVSLGFIYMTDGKTQQAAKLLDKAIALNPDYDLALINRAELYFYTADYQQSADMVFKILKKHPGDERAKSLLQKLAGKTVLN
ncbi:MAG: tetratricopeptide repeat protein [Chitinophagales bacterium]|nr:tetratricopeptide repeat protein [Chitinophagales bacterium]